MTKTRRAPWYKRGLIAGPVADMFIHAFAALPEDSPYRLEAKGYANLAAVRLVFESNCIEDVGPPLGDTQRIIDRYFPKLPEDLASFKGPEPEEHVLASLSPDRFQSVLDGLDEAEALESTVIPSYTFKGKRKELFPVVWHYMAYLEALTQASQFSTARMQFLYRQRFMERPEAMARLSPEQRAQVQSWPTEFPRLFTEAGVREIHSLLATDQLPEDCKTAPGEYRVTEAHVRMEKNYLKAELVPAAMSEWEKRCTLLPGANHPWALIAGVASHSFLEIHPFPDVNGRTSRLLVSMALRAGGVPFPISIRATKKSRQQYFKALRHADRVKIDWYVSLIMIQVIDGFLAIQRNVMLTGATPLIETLPDEFFVRKYQKSKGEALERVATVLDNW